MSSLAFTGERPNLDLADRCLRVVFSPQPLFLPEYAPKMKSRRRTVRKKPNTPIQVVDRNSSSQLGMVVNLTHEGLLLVSQEPLPVYQIYELELVLGTSRNAPSNIFFGAETVWSDQSGMHTNYYWTGFSIIDISDETISVLKQLTADWDSDGD